jgi:hypothetical protein
MMRKQQGLLASPEIVDIKEESPPLSPMPNVMDRVL